MTDSVYVFPSIFPTPETEAENRVICVGGYGRKEQTVSRCFDEFKFIPDA